MPRPKKYVTTDEITLGGKVVYETSRDMTKEEIKVAKNVTPEGFDTSSYLKNQMKAVADKLLDKVLKGKATSRDYELYYKLTGVIKASEGGTTIINGAFFAEQAKRSGNGERVVEVQERPALLHQPVCEDTGQGGVGDTTVQVVGLPDTDSPDDPE